MCWMVEDVALGADCRATAGSNDDEDRVPDGLDDGAYPIPVQPVTVKHKMSAGDSVDFSMQGSSVRNMRLL